MDCGWAWGCARPEYIWRRHSTLHHHISESPRSCGNEMVEGLWRGCGRVQEAVGTGRFRGLMLQVGATGNERLLSWGWCCSGNAILWPEPCVVTRRLPRRCLDTGGSYPHIGEVIPSNRRVIHNSDRKQGPTAWRVAAAELAAGGGRVGGLGTPCR